MKKLNVFVMMVCAIGIMATSCVKENETLNNSSKQEKTATAKRIGNNLKTTDYSGSFSLVSMVGHTSQACNNGCTMIGGERCHINCQGFGNTCNLNASILVSKIEPDNPENIFYKGVGLNDYEPTDIETYNLPARSFYIEDENAENGYYYMNIPEQILERDPSSNQFLYYNITFTETAIYDNL